MKSTLAVLALAATAASVQAQIIDNLIERASILVSCTSAHDMQQNTEGGHARSGPQHAPRRAGPLRNLKTDCRELAYRPMLSNLMVAST